MNYQHSHHLLRVIMPSVKSKTTFAVIAAVADLTWGYQQYHDGRQLSISEIATAAGISESGARKALNDDDFLTHVSQSPIDLNNPRKGYFYSMKSYDTEGHSDNGAKPESNKAYDPAGQSLSPRVTKPKPESDKATSGLKNIKESFKEIEKEDTPASISDILPRHFQDFETQHHAPTEDEQVMFDLLMGFCRKASPNSVKKRAIELVEMGASADTVQREFNSQGGWWYQTTADGKNGLAPFAGNVANGYDPARQWREAKKQEVVWSPL